MIWDAEGATEAKAAEWDRVYLTEHGADPS
jgi:hypothetical protein